MMECGQADESAKGGLSTRPSVVVGPEEDEKKDGAVPREDSVDADAVTVLVTELEEFNADNAPYGMEVFGEWKEGPHRIIERRTGPGEEVCPCPYVVCQHVIDEWHAIDRGRGPK
jgi:hypothetical protein